MKIALIGPTHPFRGGISHYTTLLYRHLKRGHDTRFYAFRRQYPAWLFPGKGDRDPSEQGLVEPGAELVLDGFNPLSFAALGWRLRRDPPDLVIVPWWVVYWAPHVLSLLAVARPKQVFFVVHNVREHEDNALKPMLTRLVLDRGTRFLVHSREDEERLLQLKPDASVVRVFHPTYEELAPPEVPRADARAQVARETGLVLDDETPVILFFGFVRPYKGLPDLAEALPQMRHDARVLVVGEFWKDSRAEFDAQVDALGIGDRVGCVDRYVANEEVPLYFSASDMVALPYRSGTGSGILQMAFGYRRPVVATCVGSQADAVRHGETGLLVPPKRPDLLANALDRLIEMQATVPFEANIAADVRARFSWESLVERIEAMAKSALDAHD